MSKFNDQSYLKNNQYRDASNLNARIELHRRFSVNPQGWFPWIFDTLEKLPVDARVLELGCGAGSLWTNCPDRIPPGWVITISDLSEGMVLEAWRKMVVLGRAFKFEQIDAQSIPYPDETFDVVIANHMIFHIPDRPKALAEIRRVLKPGGHLIATTVGENHLKEMDRWLNPGTEKGTHQFTLENGLEQLKPFFGQIDVLRYSDSLRITEIPPLLTYLRSTLHFGEMPHSALNDLEHALERELQLSGEIFVTKDSGLFCAIK